MNIEYFGKPKTEKLIWYVNFKNEKETRYNRSPLPIFTKRNPSDYTDGLCSYACELQPECLKKSKDDRCISELKGKNCYCKINTSSTKDLLWRKFRSYYSYPGKGVEEAEITKKQFIENCYPEYEETIGSCQGTQKEIQERG